MEQTITKSECKEFTIFELMGEISRLKKENEQLKADNIVLHSKLNNQNTTKDFSNDDIGMLDEYEEEYLSGCESEEDLEDYEKAFDNYSL